MYYFSVPKALIMNTQLWIGLAEVRPLAECNLLEGARGAYVHVMASANNADEFRAAIVRRATELQLVLIDLSQTEPWSIRSSGDEPIRDEFFEMAERAKANLKLVVFGRFHAWFQDLPISESKPASAMSAHASERKSRTAEASISRPKPGTENGQ